MSVEVFLVDELAEVDVDVAVLLGENLRGGGLPSARRPG